MFLMGPVVDVVATVQNVIDMVIQATQLLGFTWLLSGGILFLVRTFSFYLDGLIVNFIGAVYKYFTALLGGTMFNEAVVDAIMKNVYVFIGVLVFFRVAMLLLKYIVNPELVEDGKLGVNKLVKRVIFGMIGIILTPTIFSFAINIQGAFIQDQVIQKILIPEDLLEISKSKMDNAGKYLGTYVWAGFLNPATKAPERIEKQFKSALKKGDLSSLDVNNGGFLGMGYDVYNYSYFIFLSTFVLGYVLYLMIKYCLDLISRLFKLFLYQLIAPIAMIEYMINGSDDGVFKSWKNAVLGTYFLLFVRVFALWFVIFVMTLMSGELPNDTYISGSLLTTDDYLLRALIILALLGFMMDLPKLLSNIFGIDLEQQGSAGGLLDSVKGMFGKVAGAGLAMGGAAIGGALGAAKGIGGTATSAMAKNGKSFGTLNSKWNNSKLGQSKFGQSKFGKALSGSLFANNQERMAARGAEMGSLKTSMDAVKGANKSMFKSAMSSNSYTGSLYSGYNEVNDTIKAKQDKRDAKAAQKDQMDREETRNTYLSNIDKRLERLETTRVVETIRQSEKGASMDPDKLIKKSTEAVVDAKIGSVDLSAIINSLNTCFANGATVDVVANLASQQLGKLDVPAQEVKTIVKAVYDDSSISVGDKGSTIVREVKTRCTEITEKEVENIVNETYDYRPIGEIGDSLRSIDEHLGGPRKDSEDA